MASIRAIPTLLRVGVAETVAYRGEFLVWILTTTMPLVMLGLWTSVADEAPFRGYSSADFVAYYLVNLIVRNLTGCWVAWQMSEEIRTGTMAMRLLRPMHPFIALASSHAAAIPFRCVVALPVALGLLASSGSQQITGDPLRWAAFALSIPLAWLTTFSMMFALGTLAFFTTRGSGVMQLYFALYSVLSGYLIRLDLLPSTISEIARWSPFPATLAVPIEILVPGAHPTAAGWLLAQQAGWAIAMVALALAAWRRGVKRFEAVGG